MKLLCTASAVAVNRVSSDNISVYCVFAYLRPSHSREEPTRQTRRCCWWRQEGRAWRYAAPAAGSAPALETRPPWRAWRRGSASSSSDWWSCRCRARGASEHRRSVPDSPPRPLWLKDDAAGGHHMPVKEKVIIKMMVSTKIWSSTTVFNI